jgi:hypothetical protein
VTGRLTTHCTDALSLCLVGAGAISMARPQFETVSPGEPPGP